MDPKERIARQRKLLQKKLGLNMGEAIGMSTEELFNDEDLDYTPTSAALVNKQPVGKTFGCLTASNNTGDLLLFWYAIAIKKKSAPYFCSLLLSVTVIYYLHKLTF